jgi:c-di-GMP-binding flagellar brake protein YcgR
MLQKIHKVFSRRKHSRFHAKEKTFIVFQPFTPGEKKLQIIDISEGGCGFIYTGDESDLEALGQVNLMSEDSQDVQGINILKVRDQRLSGPYRKRGIEFKWLGSLDKQRLKKFIEVVSLCKCS